MDNDNHLDLLQALLKQITIEDPAILSLIEQEVGHVPSTGPQKDISDEVINRLRVQNKKLVERVTALKDRLKDNAFDMKQIMNQLNDLAKLNSSLAAALGACSYCWGEDSKCSHCHGKGLPGWRKVNKQLFNTYVLPALEKLNGLQINDG